MSSREAFDHFSSAASNRAWADAKGRAAAIPMAQPAQPQHRKSAEAASEGEAWLSQARSAIEPESGNSAVRENLHPHVGHRIVLRETTASDEVATMRAELLSGHERS